MASVLCVLLRTPRKQLGVLHLDRSPWQKPFTMDDLRLADALIKAGKDFDLIVIPGAGHGSGGQYGERRRNDFFVHNLLGIEPPDRNGAKP